MTLTSHIWRGIIYYFAYVGLWNWCGVLVDVLFNEAGSASLAAIVAVLA
jgi:hypothetical protein